MHCISKARPIAEAQSNSRALGLERGIGYSTARENPRPAIRQELRVVRSSAASRQDRNRCDYDRGYGSRADWGNGRYDDWGSYGSSCDYVVTGDDRWGPSCMGLWLWPILFEPKGP